jgi:hypothetical protein
MMRLKNRSGYGEHGVAAAIIELCWTIDDAARLIAESNLEPLDKLATDVRGISERLYELNNSRIK